MIPLIVLLIDPFERNPNPQTLRKPTLVIKAPILYYPYRSLTVALYSTLYRNPIDPLFV